MARYMEEVGADLRRGLALLATVGSVAPFVGLLGTVLGIISAFQGIAVGRLGRSGRGVGRHQRGAHRDRFRPGRGDSVGAGLQLPQRARGEGGDAAQQRGRRAARPDGRLARGGGERHQRAVGVRRQRAVRVGVEEHAPAAMRRGRRWARRERPRLRRRARRQRRVTPDINITPLVDVVLVLLIIFMVVAPQMEQDIPVDAARHLQPRSRRRGRTRAVMVSLTKDGSSTSTSTHYDLDGALAALSELHANDPTAPPGAARRRRAARTVDVRDVFFRIQEVGFPGVSLMVEPQVQGRPGDERAAPSIRSPRRRRMTRRRGGRGGLSAWA